MRFKKPSLFVIPVCMLLLAAAVPNLLVEGGLADTPWPTYGGNLRNTGQSPYVGPQEAVVKWAVDITGNCIFSQPVIGCDGTVYFGTCQGPGTFYAINPDGTTKWTLQPDDEASFETSAVLAEDGTLYVGMYFTEISEGDKGRLYALDSSDGSVQWTFDVPSAVYVSPKIAADGTIYFADETTFFAVNPDGTEKWSFNTDECWPWYGSLAVGDDGTVYLLVDYALYALNPDGTVNWSYATDDIAGSTAIGADGTIYITVWSNVLCAVNPDGTEKWSVDSAEFHYVVVAADGTLYTTATDGVHAFNSDGAELWHFVLADYNVQTAPLIGADGTIYFGTTYTSHILYALNPDGTEKWSFTTEYTNMGSPSIGPDGTLYFPSGEWPGSMLYAFEGPPPAAVASSSLDATANLVMGMVGIDLDRESIDYGDVAAGESSAVETVVATNVGTLDCDVNLEVVGADEIAQDFYEQSLYVDGSLYNIDTTIASIAVDGSEDVETQLQVPLSWAEPGVQEATFVFWAEAS
jgi:outer membrane protein assembly factor BamB